MKFNALNGANHVIINYWLETSRRLYSALKDLSFIVSCNLGFFDVTILMIPDS